ncbi:MAG: tetratricopeptide repeat protein [Nitrospirota bacterium]
MDTVGYHIVNLIIHIINALLVYWFVVLTFKTSYFLKITQSPHPPFTKGGQGGINLIALFSALLFVSHPIQTQAVTYLVQRFTSLATFFYLLSPVMYINWRLRIQNSELGEQRIEKKQNIFNLKSGFWYLASLFFTILAMMTKEISFTLPIVTTFYEFMFFDGKTKKKILFLIPLLLTMLIIPLNMIGIDKPIGDVIGELREATQETEEIQRWSYLFTQFRVIVTYIRLLFLPINQNLDYDYPVFHSFFDSKVFLSFLFLLLILGLGIYLLYRSHLKVQKFKGSNNQYSTFKPSTLKLISFGILWFFITLSVESSIIPIRDVIFEHRLYLPSVGIIVAFGTAVFYAFDYRKIKNVTRILPVIIIVLLSISTFTRNLTWKDGITLWEDVVKKSPLKGRPHYNLGLVYKEHNRYEDAIKEFQTAIKLNPNITDSYSSLGVVYAIQNRYEDAIKEFQTAIKLNPGSAAAHNNIGVVYKKQGLYESAIKEYQIAMNLNPYFADPYNNIGVIYEIQGRYEDALKAYRTAIKFKPENAVLHNNIGIVYLKYGLHEDAIREFQIAIKLRPDYTDALYNLSTIYKKQRHFNSK